MTVPVRQPSFAGGELSPTLWARTEFEKYAVGARLLRNFVVTPHGAAANRPGTWHGAELASRVRLREFEFSESDTMLLVFGAGWLRFFTTAGPVLGANGQPFQLDTQYGEADLKKLRFAQIGNVMRVTCSGFAPADLVRTSTSPFVAVLTSLDFDIPKATGEAYVFAPDVVAADATHPARQWAWKITEVWQDQDGTVWETAPLEIVEAAWRDGEYWVDTMTYAANDYVRYVDTYYRSLGDANRNHSPVEASSVWWVEDALPATRITHRTALPGELVLFTDEPVRLWWPSTFSTPHRNWLSVEREGGKRRLARRIYRGRGDVFGYVGEARDGEMFTDTGDVPNFALSPPQGRNPFKVYDGDYLVRTERPAAVAFQDQRCVLAGTAERPGGLFFSRIDAWWNFDDHAQPLADDALEFELAASRREEVRALVPGDPLLVFTTGGEWAVAGGQEGAPVTALAFTARQRTARGTSWVEPVKVGDAEVLFFPPAGNLRELLYDGQRGSFVAGDLTLLSRHLFQGHELVDRAWQEEPWSVLWVVRDDGALLSLTYVREHQVVAWARHDTQGAVESVCALREGAEDVLWLVVNRNGRRFLERMASRLVTDAVEGLFLDAAVTYRGAPTRHVPGLGHLEGRTVSALADGYPVHALVVTGGAVELSEADFPDGASVVHVGLTYVSEVELLDVAPSAGRSRVKSVSSVSVEFEGSRGGWVGQAFDRKLSEWRQRRLAHGYGLIPLEHGQTTIPVSSDWNTGGRAVLRQVDPLPITLLSVTRHVEYGGQE